jgi:hypothetical protein
VVGVRGEVECHHVASEPVLPISVAYTVGEIRVEMDVSPVHSLVVFRGDPDGA